MIFENERPGNMHLNWWQKIIVFVLSILIVPFLTMFLLVEVMILESGRADGDVAWIFGLPIGIILGAIFPFILFPLLEKIKLPDKEQIEFTLKSIWRFWPSLALIVLADISWTYFTLWILGSGGALARGWIYKEFGAGTYNTYNQNIAMYRSIGVAIRVGTWLVIAINLAFLIAMMRKIEQLTRKERHG